MGDPSVLIQRDDLEHERLCAPTVVGRPVQADGNAAVAAFDEFLRASTAIAGPPREIVDLLREDRPGLVGTLSARRPAPPQTAALDASPNRVRCKERGERTGIATLQRSVGRAKVLDSGVRH